MTTPLRAPWSLRRTATIDMSWPDGPRGRLVQHGRARDVLTYGERTDVGVLAEQGVLVVVSPERTITRVDPVARGLVGAPAISGFRRRLAALADPSAVPGTLAYQLLDDIPGATIVSDFALRVWSVHADGPAGSARQPRKMIGLCRGFSPGSSALNPDGSSTGFHHVCAVASLPRADDPLGWHRFDDTPAMSMRRARRVDVRIDGASVAIDAMFQDSASAPGGGRMAVHQYHVNAVAARSTLSITALTATPGNLPYDECPLAAANVHRLVGTRLDDLRSAVPTELRATVGCTHLNDALRGLADVPLLVGALTAERAAS